MDVLVVGSGSREHALAWKLKQSPKVGKVYLAPGNGGTSLVGENVPIGVMEFDKLVRFAEEKKVGLTVIGMEDPIAEVIVDLFRSRGLKVFGPTKGAAQIEASKAFAKELMRETDVPTAAFQTFTDRDKALAYVKEKGTPIVVKASGLAAGKGVYICQTVKDADTALREIMFDNIFKESGSTVVIEGYLDGQEISVHAFCDGSRFAIIPPSQDHKQIGESDTGKNAGGMGVIAPVPWVADEVMKDIETRVVAPTLEGLSKRGIPFSGILYPGLKMTPEGPKVLEFNARFGAPEAEVYMRLLKTDLFDILEACADGKLGSQDVAWNPGFAVTVIMASGG